MQTTDSLTTLVSSSLTFHSIQPTLLTQKLPPTTSFPITSAPSSSSNSSSADYELNILSNTDNNWLRQVLRATSTFESLETHLQVSATIREFFKLHQIQLVAFGTKGQPISVTLSRESAPKARLFRGRGDFQQFLQRKQVPASTYRVGTPPRRRRRQSSSLSLCRLQGGGVVI